jgi:hypothetical protein
VPSFTSRAAPDSRVHSATSARMTLHFARRVEEIFLPVRAKSIEAQPFDSAFFKDFIHREGRSFDRPVRRKHEDGQA